MYPAEKPALQWLSLHITSEVVVGSATSQMKGIHYRLFRPCSLGSVDFKLRSYVAASAIGFGGSSYKISSLCIEACGTKDFNSAGSALYLSHISPSSCEMVHLSSCIGKDSPFVMDGNAVIQQTFTRSNNTYPRATLHPCCAVCCCSVVSYSHFCGLKAEVRIGWLDKNPQFLRCNFVDIETTENSCIFYVHTLSTSFDTCCFVDYTASVEFKSGSGTISFTNCRADAFFGGFPQGVSSIGSGDIELIERFPMCTNQRISINCKQNKMHFIGALLLVIFEI